LWKKKREKPVLWGAEIRNFEGLEQKKKKKSVKGNLERGPKGKKKTSVKQLKGVLSKKGLPWKILRRGGKKRGQETSLWPRIPYKRVQQGRKRKKNERTLGRLRGKQD